MRNVWKSAMKKEPGIDGILVTVGLCIIALLLCVVMKDSMTTKINYRTLDSSHENSTCCHKDTKKNPYTH